MRGGHRKDERWTASERVVISPGELGCHLLNGDTSMHKTIFRLAAGGLFALAVPAGMSVGTASAATVPATTTPAHVAGTTAGDTAAAASVTAITPQNTVTWDCGSVTLALSPNGGGNGTVNIRLQSFDGPISSVWFTGLWVKSTFPFGAGGFNSSQARFFGLGTANVFATLPISPGAGTITADLIGLTAKTPAGTCVAGIFPNDTRDFT